MRCVISLAVIGSAFTVFSSLPAGATIPLSGDLNAIADTNINNVIVSDPESDSWTGVPTSLAASTFATQSIGNDIITAFGNATATWSSTDSGTVNFNDYGWNYTVHNAAVTFSEVTLANPDHDWTYRFTATSDGEITLDFDISLVSGSGFGLLGWNLLFTGPGGAGAPTVDLAIDPTQHGVFTAPLVAGVTYRISIDGLADNFSHGPLGDAAGTMNGSFTWAITSNAAAAIPEPSAWTMLLVGFAGLGLVGRRRVTRTLAARV
jgi:hypothetical protein